MNLSESIHQGIFGFDRIRYSTREFGFFFSGVGVLTCVSPYDKLPVVLHQRYMHPK